MITILKTSPANAETTVFEMRENGALLGSSKFIGNEIVEISAQNEFAAAALAKAVLNDMDLRGCRNAVCNIKQFKAVLKKLGFIESDNSFILNLDGYFTKKCENKNGK